MAQKYYLSVYSVLLYCLSTTIDINVHTEINCYYYTVIQ